MIPQRKKMGRSPTRGEASAPTTKRLRWLPELAERHAEFLQLRLVGIRFAIVKEAVVAGVHAQDLVGVRDRAEIFLGARQDLTHSNAVPAQIRQAPTPRECLYTCPHASKFLPSKRSGADRSG